MSKSQVSGLLFKAMFVLGVALFTSAKWLMLDSAAAGSLTATYSSRFVEIAVCVVVAILFYNRKPSLRAFFAIVIPFLVLYALAFSLAPAFRELGTAEEFTSAASVLYGVASALFMLLYYYMFSRMPLKQGAVLLALSQFLANLFMFVFRFIDPNALVAVRLLFLLTGPVLVLLCLVKVSGEDAPGREERESAPDVFPTRRFDWILLFASAALFSSVFGLVSQVSSETGTGLGLYDSGTTLILLVFEALILVFLAFSGDTFTFPLAFLAVAVLFATGLVLYPNSWSGGRALAGALIRTGFDFASVLLWILLLRKAHFNPERAFFWFGLYRTVVTVYPGRLLGLLLVKADLPQTALVGEVSQFCLWAICIFGILVFFFTSQASANLFRSPADASGTATAPSVAEEASETATAIDAFARKVESFCERMQLSDREREVLVETLRGQSRAAVGRKLYLSPDTVKNYLHRIYSKAQVGSRQELIELIDREDVP